MLSHTQQKRHQPSPNWTVFSWLVPAPTVIAPIVLCSIAFVYGADSTAFMVGLVAALFHVFLIVYFYPTRTLRWQLQVCILLCWLLCVTVMWCNVLYFFVKAITKTGDGGWTSIGCGFTSLTIALDMALLLALLLPLLGYPEPARTPPQKRASISCPVYAAQPTAAQQFQNHYSAPVPPPDLRIPGGSARLDNVSFWSPTSMVKLPIGTVSSVPAAATRSMSVSQISSQTSARSMSVSQMVSQAPVRSMSVSQMISQTPWYPYDRRNRVDVIRRLCSLQHPDGHWQPSAELTELVAETVWSGNRQMRLDEVHHDVVEDEEKRLSMSTRKATKAAFECLAELCNLVWDAQARASTQHMMLSAAEMISLQAVSWDLSWARNSLERAAAWTEAMHWCPVTP